MRVPFLPLLVASVFGAMIHAGPAGAQDQQLAAPQDVQLHGLNRSVDMASPIGRVTLRWQRALEDLFGSTPERAVQDAARTVSRALKRGGFPTSVTSIDLDWQIVFLSEQALARQAPAYLVNNCHPGWILPPAQIYIVPERVAAGCATEAGPPQTFSTSAADSALAQVLIHEMGHAVDFHLLRNNPGSDRIRAEGFASWFEQYASDFSSVIPRDAARNKYEALARQSFDQSVEPVPFSGSGADYGRASMYIRALVERKGVAGLVDVYEYMLAENLQFFDAAQKRWGWDRGQFEKEAVRLIAQ